MKQDKNFVDSSDMNELRYWAKKFKISIAELLAAIIKDGNKVSVLKNKFNKKRSL